MVGFCGGGDHLLDRNVFVEFLTEQRLHLMTRHRRVREFVAGHEEVSLLLPLHPIVHVGVLRGDVERQLITFLTAPTASAFEVTPGEPLVHQLRRAFELPDLQGGVDRRWRRRSP